MKKVIFKKSQKGFSVISIFFIMAIILSVVIGMSLIIFNQTKIINNIEDSLIAFYLADSGIEKLLYYNRKIIPTSPTEIVGGACNICNSCLADDCKDCQAIGDDCVRCKKCKITYTTDLGDNDKKHETVVSIFPNGQFFNMDVSLKGFYKNTLRVIGLQLKTKDLSSSSPLIENVSAIRSGGVVAISADITDLDGINLSSVKAYIRNSNNPEIPDVDIVWLNPPVGEGNTYTNSWFSGSGYYYIYVKACDNILPFPNCSESRRVPILDN